MTTALSRTIGRTIRHRDHSTANPSQHQPTLRDVYLSALRCCLIPVLDSGIDKTSVSRPSGEYSHSYSSPAGGGTERSFADEARRAAEKLRLHVHGLDSGDASTEERGTVRLAYGTLKAFRKLLTTRVQMVAGKANDPRTVTFVKAGGRYASINGGTRSACIAVYDYQPHLSSIPRTGCYENDWC